MRKLRILLATIGALAATTLLDAATDSTPAAAPRPAIRKLGCIDLDIVETTPFLFKDRVYRMEWFRSGNCLRIMDRQTGAEISRFGADHRFASAYVEAGKVYVVGTKTTDGWFGVILTLFTSEDLKTWAERKIFEKAGMGICNTSVCKTGDRYVMSIELTSPDGFPARFLESKDLLNWTLMPEECRHFLGRYNAAHCLRWHDGWFYLFYLEAGKPHGYEQYVTRSRDLVHWESSPLNPVLAASPEDQRIANPRLTEDQRQKIANAKDINNSDIDFCEYAGKLVINYSWGNQTGTEFLAEAEFDGSQAQFLTGWFPKAPAAPAPYGPVPTRSQLQWHELEMYAFMHFGVDTFTDKEWGFGDEKESVFNPTAFDADQMVRAAKDGGMKGVILTAKHHDGFCLWPSKFTEHCVRNSPWKDGKGDVVAEFAAACKKHGLRFGLYLSPWDRNHPEYARAGYVDYYKNQIRELLTNYGPIFEMWFDGANGGDGYYGGKPEKRTISENYYDWKGVVALIRQLQPECAIWGAAYPEDGRLHHADCHWGGSEGGDVGDPCWSTLNSKKTNADIEDWRHGHRDGDVWCGAEGDVSIRPGWFYHASQDGQVKSPQTLMDIYLSCVGRGANLILNIPPDRRGLIHENDVKALRGFRKLMEETFSSDLAKVATATASQVRGGADSFAPKNLIDGKSDTFWATDDAVTTPEVTLEFQKPVTFNLVRLREYLPLGQRVDDWALDAWQGGAWKEFAKGTAIGNCRLVRTAPSTTTKVRLRITKAAACPALSEFALFAEPAQAASGASASPEQPKTRATVLPKGVEYFTLRDGLGNCRAKFEREKTGRVAFLGGSITFNSGWRDELMHYLQGRFPDTKFEFIAAGIPSLGSVPHAFRLERDVLSKGPVDLLFVEAAVNDHNYDDKPNREELALRGMEGVVRHARAAQPHIDIVEMHFVSPSDLTDYAGGKVPYPIAQHERVATHYACASLNLALEVADRIDAKEFTWAGDFRDVHPSPFGQRIYATSMIRMLEAAFAAPAQQPKPHALPPMPIDERSYFHGRFGKIEDARIVKGFMLDPKWTPTDGKEARAGFVNVPTLVGTQPGDEFQLTFDGTGVGLFITSGPDSGMVEFNIDEAGWKRMDTFTAWSTALHLPWALMLDDGLKAGRHTVHVRLAAEHNPKSSGTALRVMHLLYN